MAKEVQATMVAGMGVLSICFVRYSNDELEKWLDQLVSNQLCKFDDMIENGADL